LFNLRFFQFLEFSETSKVNLHWRKRALVEIILKKSDIRSPILSHLDLILSNVKVPFNQ